MYRCSRGHRDVRAQSCQAASSRAGRRRCQCLPARRAALGAPMRPVLHRRYRVFHRWHRESALGEGAGSIFPIRTSAPTVARGTRTHEAASVVVSRPRCRLTLSVSRCASAPARRSCRAPAPPARRKGARCGLPAGRVVVRRLLPLMLVLARYRSGAEGCEVVAKARQGGRWATHVVRRGWAAMSHEGPVLPPVGVDPQERRCSQGDPSRVGLDRAAVPRGPDRQRLRR